MRKLRLKEVLEATKPKISQGKLSRGTDVSLQTINRMVNNPDYVPGADTLFKIAEYLGVSVDELYAEVPDDQ